MKLIWSKKYISLSVWKRKLSPYWRRGVIRYYHYRDDPKLVQVEVYVWIKTRSFQSCHIKISPTWDTKIKDRSNQFIYRRVIDFKFSQILGTHNSWIIMNFIDYETDGVEYDTFTELLLIVVSNTVLVVF